MQQRRRFKHTTTLAERLAARALDLREQARQKDHESESAKLLRQARQLEASIDLEGYLTSRELEPPK